MREGSSLMDLLLGFLALVAFAALLACILSGYPPLLSAFALMLYRHAKKQERWKQRQTRALDEAWCKELESGQ